MLDLFCGAGGLSRGFQDAGYNVVLGVDNNETALSTFKNNHKNSEVLNLDLFNHEQINEITKFLQDRQIDIDVLVGGPPCQGFSLAGPRDEKDERNTLYTAMVKVAEIIKPRAIVLENVPGLLTLYEGKAKNRIYEDFEALGYSMQSKILYAPNYGIPQIRKRVFFVGVLNDLEFSYPEPIISNEQNFVTTFEAIGDLPPREDEIGKEIDEYIMDPFTDYQKKMRGDNNILYNHLGTNHIEKTKKLIALVPEGKNYKSLPEKYRNQFKYNEALTRYDSKKPSLTINTGHRSHFHYKYNRVPSVRENARLQSFTDDFIFLGSKTEQYKLVGNAVPPLLGYYLGLALKNSLQGDIDNEI